MAYDFERMLALDGLSDKAVGNVSRAAMRDDGTCEIRYSCNAAAFSEGAKWLRENRLTISDMDIGGVALEGLWRTVGIQGQEERDRSGNVTGAFLVVRMAKGYYEAWNWEAVRVRQGELKHGNNTTVDGVAIGNSELYQRQAVLTLPFVDPARAQTTAETLTAVSWTGLVAGGVTFSGVWFNMGAIYEEGEDGTAAVSLRLGKPQYTVEGYRGHDTWEGEQSYYVSNVPQTRVQAVMDAWKTLDGTAEGAARTGANATIMGGVNTDANTVNIILTVPVVEEKLNQRGSSSETCFDETTGRTHLHQAAVEAHPGFTQGEIVTVQSEETPLGTFHNTRETREDKQDVEGQRRHTESAFEGQLGETIRNQTAPGFNSATPPAQTAGTIVTHQATRTESCLWDNDEATRTANEVDEAETSQQIAAFDTTTSQTDRNKATPISEELSQTAGQIVQTRNSVNDFDLNDHETSTRVATERVNATRDRQVTTFEDTQSALDRNETDADLHPGTTVAGRITQKQAALNDAMRYDNTTTERIAETVTDAQKVDTNNTFETTARDTIRNKSAAVRTPSSANGVIESVTLEKSEFPERTHDTLESRTSKVVADAQKVDTSNTFETTARDTIRNKAAAARVAASANGVIQEVTIEKSEFPDRWHDTLNQRTSIPVTDAQKSDSETTYEETESATDRNVTTASTPTVGDGLIVQQTVEKSEFPQRFHDTVQTRKSLPVADARTSSTENTFEEQESNTIRNSASAARTAASALGVIQAVTVEKSEFPGRIHDTLEQRTATPVTDARTSKTILAFETVESDEIRNAASARITDNESIPGTIRTQTVEKSEFPDRVHDTIESRAVNDGAVAPGTAPETPQSDVETAFEHAEMRGLRNQADPLGKVDVSPGVITDVRSTMNDARRWDVQKTERNAKTGETAEHNVRVLHNNVTEKAHRARHVVIDGGEPAWAVAPTPGSLATGTGVAIQRTLNEFDGLQIERQEIETTVQRRPATGQHSINTIDGIIYEVEYDNVHPGATLNTALTQLVAFEATHTISPDLRFKPETGTYDLRLRAYPPRGSAGGGLQAFQETWTGYQWVRKMVGGQLLRQKETYTHGSILSPARGTVKTFIENEGNPQMRQFKHGEQTWYHGSFQTLTTLSAFAANETTVP